VQNIDMMNLTGFCRNCLSRWYQEAAAEKGVEMDKEAAREIVYGMPYDEWKAKYQTEASAEQKAAFDIVQPRTLTEAPFPPAPNGDRAVRRLFRQRRGAGRQACPAR
jgi:hypothetical protein